MKDFAKLILILALVTTGLASIIVGIDNPKPTKLNANITRELIKVAE